MAGLSAYIRLIRPKQWVKNGFVFLPLFFGDKLLDAAPLGRVCWSFAFFSLMCSAAYVFNDIRDRELDRRHPRKRLRPLASGEMGAAAAWPLAVILAAVALAGAYLLAGRGVALILVLYLALNLAYSLGLKHLPLLDVACIAFGFVLRIVAGAVAGNVPLSQWIVVMTFLLAMFLALAKRRDDLLLTEDGHNPRPALKGYNLDFVSHALMVMAAVTLVAYIQYTLSPETMARHHCEHLYVTAFWVLLGLMRYLQIVFVEKRSGSPTAVLLKDVFLQATIIGWILTFYVLLYVNGGAS